jgi:sodium/potassium-transporting ATPase subunit alpha
VSALGLERADAVHASAFQPHTIHVERLFTHLASSARGLSQREAAKRLHHDGPNAITEQARAALAVRFGRHLTHRFALLLWAGALLALVGDRFRPGEGMALIAATLPAVVVLNAAFSFWQESRAEHAMAAFRRILSTHARVLRDGREVDVEAATVVAGDVVVLREGDRVPADARLIEAHALKVDNAPLTGESEPQLRSLQPSGGSLLASRNLVFSGTLVTAGRGTAVVYAIGNASAIGHIARVTRETPRVETPIRRELAHFIHTISAIAIGLGIVFFVIGWLIGNPFWTNLIFAIGIIVANVPEGLLPTVTLALAIAGRRMARRQALLKTLESAETLGGTTVICTDKTGTLTLNDMRVTDLYIGGDREAVDDAGAPARVLALRTMALCNNAILRRTASRTQLSGDPTETALLAYADGAGAGMVEQTRAALPRVHERPFDSATREMATVHRGPDGLEVFLKGAPEVVIGHCVRVLRPDGAEPMTPALAAETRRWEAARARAGCRVLALAHKRAQEQSDLEALTAGGYDLVGLVAMHDPPRAEVHAAVRACRRAGIRIVVVSGDHPLTVEAIAREVGIVTSATPRIYTGEDLTSWSAAALRHALETEEVGFARTSPLDKLRIVTALQAMGHVVAVTGDGVNDAPALKRADIGIAMGRTGTDVAREASDMVLMDDNFATIVAAVEEGRVIYHNIRRFVGYVLTSNVPEILPYIAFVLLGIPLPLPVLLILAIDLGTDLLPAVGLATEPAEADVMLEPPRRQSERLLSPGLLITSYGLLGMVESAAGFTAYLWVLDRGGWRPGAELAATDPLYGQAVAAYFGAIVLSQMANVMVWRTTHESVVRKGLLRNRAILAGLAAEAALGWLVVQSDAGQAVFGTNAPPAATWLVPLPFALAMVAAAETVKVLRRRPPCFPSAEEDGSRVPPHD